MNRGDGSWVGRTARPVVVAPCSFYDGSCEFRSGSGFVLLDRGLIVEKGHRSGVEAVAQARRRGSVREDVAEMAVAAGAAYLGADHAKRTVLNAAYVIGIEGRGEARPAGAAFELLV